MINESSLVRELRDHIRNLELQQVDLRRQVTELRGAVVALMEPDMPRILRTPVGVIVLEDNPQLRVVSEKFTP